MSVAEEERSNGLVASRSSTGDAVCLCVRQLQRTMPSIGRDAATRRSERVSGPTVIVRPGARSTNFMAPACAKARAQLKRTSVEAYISEVDGLVVDAARRRGDPVREFAGLDDAPHQRRDERAVRCARQPALDIGVPLGLEDHTAFGIDLRRGQRSDPTVERFVRRSELRGDAVLLQGTIPATDPGNGILD